MPLLETRGLTAFYGDFQALYGIDTALERRRDHRDHRRQRGGQVDLPQGHRRPHSGAADSVLLDGTPIGALAAADIVKLGIALVPEGRRLFPSLTVEENLLIGGYGRKSRGHGRSIASMRCFPILKERRAAPTPTPVGRPAADGRDRPRADVQSRACCCATRSASASRRSSSRHLRGAAADQGGRHQRRAGRAGHRAGDEGRRSRLLLPGGPACR